MTLLKRTLSNEIRKQGKRAACGYCGKIRRCYSLDELADRIERAFEEHYERTSDQPDTYQSMMLSDRESDYSWDREGECTVDTIMNAAEIPEAAAEDVQAVLDYRHSDFESATMDEETEFSGDAHYEQKGADHSEWESQWHGFEESLKTEARFFNQSAVEHLTSLFKGVDALSTRKGGSVIVDAGPRLSGSRRAPLHQSLPWFGLDRFRRGKQGREIAPLHQMIVDEAGKCGRADDGALGCVGETQQQKGDQGDGDLDAGGIFRGAEEAGGAEKSWSD